MIDRLPFTAAASLLGASLSLSACGAGASVAPAMVAATQAGSPANVPLNTHVNRSETVGLWVSSPSQNYVFGQDRSGKKTVMSIDAGENGCSGPTGIKVDHKANLWVACYDSDSVQSYSPGSSQPSAMYKDYYCENYCHSQGDATPPSGARPAKAKGSCEVGANPTDVAFDSRGHVFAANPFSALDCPAFSESGVAALVVWNRHSPHSNMVTITGGAAFSLDVDVAGSLYAGFSDNCYQGSYNCENAVLEVTNPTTSPSVTEIIFPVPSELLGGICVSNNGAVLNVVNVTARTISQYALPWITNEAPFNVLGPTPTQMDQGEPMFGGFDLHDKHLALGDAYGWVDVGDVGTNHWLAVSNKHFKHGSSGAAYVPSDK